MGASSKLEPEVSYCGAARGRMCGAAGRRWGRVWGDCDMWARLLTLLGLRIHAAATGASFTRRFGKMSCWQPKLEPVPRLDQFEASVRVRSTFLTDFFLFLCRKFTFGGPETGSEKKSFKTASSHDEQI